MCVIHDMHFIFDRDKKCWSGLVRATIILIIITNDLAKFLCKTLFTRESNSEETLVYFCLFLDNIPMAAAPTTARAATPIAADCGCEHLVNCRCMDSTDKNAGVRAVTRES